MTPPDSAADSAAEERDASLISIRITLCTLCLNGAGGECHVPGCALWGNRAPDIPVTQWERVELVAEYDDPEESDA
jgi:hypothetical protein